MVKAETEENQQTLRTAEESVPDMNEVLKNSEEVEFDESDRAGGTGARLTAFFGICQRQSDKPKVAENAGRFWVKNDEGEIEFYDCLDVVTLESSPRSTRFGDESQVVCRSYDGRTGMDGKVCKDCDYYIFRESNIPKEKKCKNSYVLLCVPADNWTAEPFFLQITPAGIKDWKNYAGELQNRFKRPIFSVVTHITTIERKANLGKSFVPVFNVLKALSKKEASTLRDIRIAESHRFRPVPEAAGAAAGTGQAAHEEEALGDRDPFVEE